jgi:hypothetical protein
LTRASDISLIGHDGTIIFSSSYVLMKLSQFRRQAPPVRRIEASSLVLGQLFLLPFKVHLLHG